MANPNKVGLVISALIGGWQLVWSLLVLSGWAQRISDFIFWAHMLQAVYVSKSFSISASLTLITITAVAGYIFGYPRVAIYNWLHR